MENDKKNSIKNVVINEIAEGKVEMKPTWQFTAKTVLFLVVAAVLGLVALFVSSFVFFSLRQSGAWFVPTFGFDGLRILLVAMPWILIIIVLAIGVVFEIIVNRYSVSYHKPLLYSLFAIFLLLILGGWLVSSTGLHSNMMENARSHHIPFAGKYYLDLDRPKTPDLHLGTVTANSEGGFEMETPNGEILSIIVDANTHFPSRSEFESGDRVVVVGKLKTGSKTIFAKGVRSFEDWPAPMPTKNRRMPMM